MTDEEIINDVEESEGWPKYTNRKNDLGGPTKGGITLDTLRIWRNNPNLTELDLKKLERTEARAIYQFMFIQPFHLIKDMELKHYLVDLGVLRGPRKAAIMLQDIVGARPADGWVGPKTIACIEPYKKHVKVMLIGSRFTHLETRVRESSSQEEFRDGWRNRNNRFLK